MPQSVNLSAVSGGPIRPRPDHIITPRRHGGVLFEPPAAAFRTALAAPSRPQSPGLMGQDFRRQARQDLLVCIQEHAQAIHAPAPGNDLLTRPWILTGHQVEFYHAGVWAKVIAANHLARTNNAVAIDLLVDHDVLAHTGLEIPLMEQGWPARRLISWNDHPPEIAAEFIPAPTMQQRRTWIDTINRNCLLKSDAWTDFSARLAASPAQDYVSWLSGARFGFEASQDIHVWHAPCSRLCQKPSWLTFVGAWIAQADAWTTSYNAGLQRYRLAHHLTNRAQPMPDLLSSTTQIELPFWIYGHGQPRGRMIITRGPAPALLTPTGPLNLAPVLRGDLQQQAAALGQLLTEAGLGIRPRALTLTMFARLALAEVFIHGIGGALYDQITDDLMHELFGIIPPYGCVSAAWLLNLPGRDESLPSISTLRWQRHHLRHNPQLALDTVNAPDPAVTALLQTRQEKISAMAQSLQHDRRTSRRCRTGAPNRRHWFGELQKINRQLLPYTQPALTRLDQRVEYLRGHAADLAVAHWREYFFALHGLDSLQALFTAIRHSTVDQLEHPVGHRCGQQRRIDQV